MANNLQVSLNTSYNPPRLDVDDSGGQNQVGQSPNPQTITWTLTGPLTQGNFVSMQAAEPGFSWGSKQQPRTGVFGPATISANGNSLSITDTHTDSSSNGEWSYVLRVLYNGKVYSISDTLEAPGGTVSNPVIVNKGP
jgi:hypothetical protein